MNDFNHASQMILNCPLCGKRGFHAHTLSKSPYHGGDYHRLLCESCEQKMTFTQELFEKLSKNFEMA
jgi:hypothetical protein